MRMPVRLLRLGQRGEQLLRGDVLDTDEVRLPGVAVEQHALQQVVVDDPALVAGLHLLVRLVLGTVEPTT